MTGAPRRLLLLAKLLKEVGFEVIVVSNDADLVRSECDSLGVQFEGMQLFNFKRSALKANFVSNLFHKLRTPIFLIRQNIGFLNIVRRVQPDIMIVRGSRNVLGCALFASCFTSPKLIWDIGYEPTSRGFSVIHRICAFMSDSVIAQYKGLFKNVLKLEVVPNQDFKFKAIIPAVSERTLGLVDQSCLKPFVRRSEVRLLQVGTVCPRKNQEFSLMLLAALRNQMPDREFTLQFLGESKDAVYMTSLQRLIAELNLHQYVSFVGWSDDVLGVMCDSDLLLSPSIDEGISNTIQEAMCLGLPVVASSAGGTSEIIEHQSNGFVLEEFDMTQWIESVQILLNPENYLRVSRSAQAFAASKFSEKTWVKEYCRVLRANLGI